MSSIIKVGKVQSSTGNDAITVADSGAITASGGIANAGTISAGNIGSNVTIADGASPHGWEHIKTISYNSDTASGTTTQMASVVSSKYSAYKLIVQWGSVTNGSDLFFRFLDSSGNQLSASNKYEYGALRMSETGSASNHFQGPGSDAQVGEDIIKGQRGWNGEFLIYNCFASSSDYPQIDGFQLNNSGDHPASPHAIFRYTGNDQGTYDLLVHGFLWYDVDPTYVSGFQLEFASSTNVQAGSWWSCYGLKLPTAD